jgi:proline dehydrogenase
MRLKLPFFLARRFVAAPNLEGTIPVAQTLNQQGLRVALDLLGEHVDDRQVAEESRDAYIRLIHRIAKARANGGLQANISIKLSMMGQLIDEAFCFDNLTELLDVATAYDVFVCLDMEGSDLTDSTLAIFERAYAQYPDHVGPVLQAMLKRTADDVERMCELGARVRLCKGAYKESPAVAYQDMGMIRSRYIEHMKRLIADASYPGIATHDDQLIEATKQFVQANGIDRADFEFQMLYGMRPDTQRAIAQDGYNMLVYVPYGTEWFPYYYRRLRERKENVWFLLKNLVRS